MGEDFIDQHGELLRKPVPPEVTMLQRYVTETVLPMVRKEWNPFVGNWFPLYARGSEVIPQMYNQFSDIRRRIIRPDGRKPRLLECGSGTGIIGDVASQAGFEVWNVELDGKAHDRAVQFGSDMVSQGILKPGAVHYVHGSYYLPEYWQNARTWWEKECELNEPESSQDGLFQGYMAIGLKPDPKDTLYREPILQRLQEMDAASHALEGTGLVTASGFIDVDAFYSYPSDPAIGVDMGITKQLTERVFPNTRLIFAVASNQSQEMINKALAQGYSTETRYGSKTMADLIVLRKV